LIINLPGRKGKERKRKEKKVKFKKRPEALVKVPLKVKQERERLASNSSGACFIQYTGGFNCVYVSILKAESVKAVERIRIGFKEFIRFYLIKLISLI